MGKDSGIQWTHHTFNCWRGCTRVSEACRFCYAETLSKRNPAVLAVWGPKGTRVVASEAMWRNPLKWDREAREKGERHRVFCASLADVFEDWPGPMETSSGVQLWKRGDGSWTTSDHYRDTVALTIDDCRDRLFDLILATPNLDWLLLTKRPEVAADYLVGKRFGGLAHEWGDGWPNVWLGTTVEDKPSRARIGKLLAIPAAVHWISAEPLLEEIDVADYLYRLQTRSFREWPHGRLDWVICGGESGSHRPFDLAWGRSLRDQCKAAGVAFFMKQLGANPFNSAARVSIDGQDSHAIAIDLEDSHGGDPDEWPADLRVREFPRSEVAHA